MSIKRTLLVVLATSLALVGCSSDKDNFRTNSFPAEVTAGQQDISNALIRSAEILVTGLPDENNEGMLNYQSFYTQASGTATVVLPLNPGSKMRLFELVTLPANADINQAASVSRCQWVAGCKGGKKFGDEFNPTYQWQSVVWDLRKDERVVVTPLTHLAAALAFEYAYAEESEENTTPKWLETGYYSPYSVEQAVSQVSQIFSILNIQSSFPADLTKINSLNTKDYIGAKNSVRYGALLAAWAYLQEKDSDFTESATAEFLINQAQVLQKEVESPTTAALSLANLYGLAASNLKALHVHNTSVESLVNEVITELENEVDSLSAGKLTEITPASIESLFGTTAFSDYNLGVKRARAFVENLQDQSKYFFGEEYDGLINTYLDEQKAFFKSNKDNFNNVLNLLNDAQRIYIKSYTGQPCAGNVLWKDCGYDNDSQTLTLTDQSTKKITLRMKNVTSNKQAVDIEMTGELLVKDLQNKELLFGLKDSDTAKSRVRLFYSKEVDGVQPKDIEPIGLEYQWADFTLYDKAKSDHKWTGAFSLLYRGVSDPSGVIEELHYNIDKLNLYSTVVGPTVDSDLKGKEDASNVRIEAKSSTADTYFNPKEKFGKLNGFFTEQVVSGENKTKTGLVSFKFGEESIHNQTVKYFDFYIHDESAQSFRYRFYPEVERKRQVSGQTNAAKTETFLTHNMAVCPIAKADDDSWDVEGACSPTQAFNGKRDVQKSINALWQAGAFSYVDLPGKGEHFVKLPANNKNSSGCYKLEELSARADEKFDGELISPAVLGLDSLRVRTAVILVGQPFTLFDVLIKAPKENKYNITAAISHRYKTLSQKEIDIGADRDSDNIVFNYNTDSSFKRMGSFRVYKGGVTLAESKELTLGLNQDYVGRDEEGNSTALPHKYVTASNGGQQICVTANEPFKGPAIDDAFDKEAVLSLTFRGVVYGSIRNEKGVWIARFIDGTWIPLVP